MQTIPKQEDTAEFKKQVVKRVKDGKTMAKERGLANVAQRSQSIRCRQAQRPRRPQNDAGGDGAVAATCGGDPSQSRVRHLAKSDGVLREGGATPAVRVD